MTDAETSPDVCYRHPQRESWVLCQRCGRTICPECQILAPVGVQCPDCVRETGGSVQWQRAGARRPTAAKPRRARPERPARSGLAGTLADMFRPGSQSPALTWSTIGLVVVLWIAGLVTGGLPFLYLAADSSVGIQLWRYVTSAFVYPPGFVFVLSVLLNSFFFALIAPAIERALGRQRFVVLFLAAAATSSAAMVISGSPAYGLVGVLFAMFGAYLVSVWSYPPARTQALVIIGINLLLSLALGARFLPQLVAGIIAGAGVLYLVQRYEDRPGSGRTPNLIIAAVTAGFVLLAVIRSIAF